MHSTRYEVRTDYHPEKEPYGTSLISRHRTEARARAAVEKDQRRFLRSPYHVGGILLHRIIVRVDANGEETLTCMSRSQNR